MKGGNFGLNPKYGSYRYQTQPALSPATLPVDIDAAIGYFIHRLTQPPTLIARLILPSKDSSPSRRIGILSEKSLHADLKRWYAAPDDRIETEVDGFVIDLVRDAELIEIQTRNLGSMKRKLALLLDAHPVRLVHPIAAEKWIVRQTADGEEIGRRRSPKRGRFFDLFTELVRIPHLLPHTNLTLEALLTREEEIRRDDGKGSWRRKGWSIHDRRLLEVTERRIFSTVADYLALLPTDLPSPFTTRDLATSAKIPLRLAQRAAYTLRQLNGLTIVGKQANALLYEIVDLS